MEGMEVVCGWRVLLCLEWCMGKGVDDGVDLGIDRLPDVITCGTDIRQEAECIALGWGDIWRRRRGILFVFVCLNHDNKINQQRFQKILVFVLSSAL